MRFFAALRMTTKRGSEWQKSRIPLFCSNLSSWTQWKISILMVRFIVNLCYEILHSLRARLTLSVQNDNKISVFFNEEKRFFTAFRMTKTRQGVLNLNYEILRCAQNDNKKMLRMTNITCTAFFMNWHLERSERSRFWWLDWLLIYVMRFFTHCAQGLLRPFRMTKTRQGFSI